VWFVEQCAKHPFHSPLLVSDEAGFGRDGIINFHKHNQWTEDNPRGALQSRRQLQFGINVRAGIVNDCLVGPNVSTSRLTGDHYQEKIKWYL
jgi:hypothetical protein